MSLFGRCFYDGFYVGYGSGGDVKPPYTVTFIDGAKGAERAGRIRLDRETERAYLQWRADKKNAPDDGFWGTARTATAKCPSGQNLRARLPPAATSALVLHRARGGRERRQFATPQGG